MLEKRFLNITREQLTDFDTLSTVIKDNPIEKLVISFFMMSHFKEQYDEYVLDKSRVIEFTDSTQNIIQTSQNIKISISEMLWSDRGTHWGFVKEAKDHWDDYTKVYNMLCDDLSRQTLNSIWLARLLIDNSYMYPVYQPIHYFDWNVLVKRDLAVFVDCGAYDGDTVKNFVRYYGDDYKRIFAYEPTPDTFVKLREAAAPFRDVVFRNCGVGELEGNLSFYTNVYADIEGGANFIDNFGLGSGDTSIPIVSLDNDIKEPISFIKMDVEASEMSALRGAKCHIINDKPQLAISAYHLLEDLRVIPLLIHSYNNNQRFYLRSHEEGRYGELVFYADPCD